MVSQNPFDEFRLTYSKLFDPDNTSYPSEMLMGFIDWYTNSGRQLYIDGFLHETKLPLGRPRKLVNILEQAFPKSLNELSKRAGWDEYYKANAYLFLMELDRISAPFVGATALGVAEQPELQTRNHLSFLRPLLHDGVQLVEDWATFSQGVPGVYGVGKNEIEPILHFYHSALQSIYGTPSVFASITNHSDTSIVLLRTSIELRLRRAFGVLGKEGINDKAFAPLMLSQLFAAVDASDDRVLFGVPFHIISRLYTWANIYTHLGLKSYRWSPVAALKYLQPFLLGGEKLANGNISLNSGVITTTGFINQVQSNVIASSINKKLHSPFFLTAKNCDVVIMKKVDIEKERKFRT